MKHLIFQIFSNSLWWLSFCNLNSLLISQRSARSYILLFLLSLIYIQLFILFKHFTCWMISKCWFFLLLSKALIWNFILFLLIDFKQIWDWVFLSSFLLRELLWILNVVKELAWLQKEGIWLAKSWRSSVAILFLVLTLSKLFLLQGHKLLIIAI